MDFQFLLSRLWKLEQKLQITFHFKIQGQKKRTRELIAFIDILSCICAHTHTQLWNINTYVKRHAGWWRAFLFECVVQGGDGLNSPVLSAGGEDEHVR